MFGARLREVVIRGLGVWCPFSPEARAHLFVEDVVHPFDARRWKALNEGQRHLTVDLGSLPYLRTSGHY